MKIIFLFITLIFIGNFIYSQTEKTENKIIAKNFEDNNKKHTTPKIISLYKSAISFIQL